MGAPYNNPRSKLDRAIVAWLKSQLPTGTNVYPANSSIEKSTPCVVVRAHNGTPEVPLQGLYRFRVQVEVHFPASLQPGNTNPEVNRVAQDALFAKVIDALMQSDDNATLQATANSITAAGRALKTTGSVQDKANNADMADFTCTDWYDRGLDGGNPKANDGANTNTWVEIGIFEAVACGSNVD